MFAVVGEVRSDEKIVAVNCTLLTKTVLRLSPFQSAVELLTKFVPKRLRGKPGLPAVTLDGDTEVSDGTGLEVPVATGVETVKAAVVDVPPPGLGLNTATFAVIDEAMSAASIEALSCVLLIKEVTRL